MLIKQADLGQAAKVIRDNKAVVEILDSFKRRLEGEISLCDPFDADKFAELQIKRRWMGEFTRKIGEMIAAGEIAAAKIRGEYKEPPGRML